jgi:hypothetical protein
MATVEQRDDGETNMEVRLKFWQYDSVRQRWVRVSCNGFYWEG